MDMFKKKKVQYLFPQIYNSLLKPNSFTVKLLINIRFLTFVSNFSENQTLLQQLEVWTARCDAFDMFLQCLIANVPNALKYAMSVLHQKRCRALKSA